jgi:two-component system sensor histidine kinase/response regulator
VGHDLSCPNCLATIPAGARACPTCGADIELMLWVADRQLLEQREGRTTTAPVSAEQLIPRLGDYLVEQGYVTAEQLQAALEAQAGAPASAPRQLIGQTLVELGHLSPAGLDQAVARQLLALQSALVEANRNLERRVAERTAELESALARLTEFNQLKANFIANVSHELRTPLTHIKGYNALMLDGTLGPVSSQQREALTVTSNAIGRLEGLINDLISYAAAARGELALNLRPVSLAMLVLQVLQRSQAKAERQQVRLTHTLRPELPLVVADEEKLYWILLQLTDNAIKFTPSGGQVVIGAEADAKRVRLAVQDTGIGIPADRLEDIFEPFRQLDGSSTRRYGGTGLGLALVRRIVEAHGSLVEVETAEGQGSCFAFALERYAPNAGQALNPLPASLT